MRLVLRAGATTCVAFALIHLAVACAATDEAGPEIVPDGGNAPPVDGSPPPEAGGDADASPARECSDDGFCHTALPANQTLRGVWGDGQGVVWTVSEQGALLRSDQTAWKMHASGLGRLVAVWGSAPTDVWIGGERGLFHGTGASPETLTFAPTATPLGEITSIWGTGGNDIWAVLARPEGSVPESRILHFAPEDGGAPSWSTVTVGSPETRFSHVWGSAGTGVWLAGTIYDPETALAAGHVYRRKAGALAFEPITVPGDPEHPGIPFWDFGALVSCYVISDTNVLMQGRTVGQDEGLLVRATSTDNGETFTFVTEHDGTYQGLATYAVAGFSPDDLWGVGEYGHIRHWNGAEWTTASLTVTKYPVISTFYALWAKGPNDIWTVGDNIALHFDPTKKP